MDAIFYNPIVNLFLFLYKFFGENFVVSIIFVTLIIQLILWPLSIQQYKAQKKMKTVQDKLKVVQDKRNSGKELSVAEMQMASQAFKSMCMSCLPVIIQLPFFFALFNMFNSISHSNGNGTIFNHIAYSESLKFAEGYQFHLNFLGLDLSKTIFTVGWNNYWPLALLVFFILAATYAQYYQMKLTTPPTTTPSVQEIDKSKKKKGKKQDEIKDPVDKQISMAPEQMTKIMTVLIFFFTLSSAAALSVYWLARSIFVIILTKIQLKYIIKDK